MRLLEAVPRGNNEGGGVIARGMALVSQAPLMSFGIGKFVAIGVCHRETSPEKNPGRRYGAMKGVRVGVRVAAPMMVHGRRLL